MGPWGWGTQPSHSSCVAHRLQKLETSKEKQQDHWIRLRRYSVLLQRENLKR